MGSHAYYLYVDPDVNTNE
jgi:hypothetical protein